MCGIIFMRRRTSYQGLRWTTQFRMVFYPQAPTEVYRICFIFLLSAGLRQGLWRLIKIPTRIPKKDRPFCRPAIQQKSSLYIPGNYLLFVYILSKEKVRVWERSRLWWIKFQPYSTHVPLLRSQFLGLKLCCWDDKYYNYNNWETGTNK